VKPKRAPSVGDDSDQVLREAGFPEAEIRALRAEGVIG
jgi:crotonobetainyl-CoA:carnitine CoA-transferase CaiB-like acyl-CoA transferase